MPLPALRDLEAFPVEHEGEHMVCLRDPEGYVDDGIVLSPPAFFIATLLDGQNGMLDIQYRFAARYRGQNIPEEQIQSIVTYLDEQGFLYSDRFESLRRQIHRTFAESETRPAYMAGKSYPEAPDTLRTLLDEYLEAIPAATTPSPFGSPSLLIAPHIDFNRGNMAYAHAYGRLRTAPVPETVFIFGVAHAGGEAPFIPLNKHFETPLGTLRVDGDICRKLSTICPAPDAAVDEADHFLHRNEHSIEFQAVWLAHLFGTGVRIVPILCGQLFVLDDTSQKIVPRPGVDAFLATCRETMASRNGKTMVIAGADWAHVGQRFGDSFDITPAILEHVETRDREDLTPVLDGNAERFLQSVMQDQNARRVCGLGCIYAALQSTAPQSPGHLLYYGQAPDPQGGVVSFASVCFYK